MSLDLLEKARVVVEQARRLGAQGSRGMVRRSRNSAAEWRDGKLDRVRDSTSLGLGIDLFVEGRYSSHSTNDLRSDAVQRFLDDAIASTRLLEPDPHRKLPDPSRYANRFAGDLEVFDAAAVDTAVVDLRRAAPALEAAARSEPGADQLISVTTRAEQTAEDEALVVSNGMEGEHRSTKSWFWAEASVRDDGDRKPEGWFYAATCRKQQLPAVEQVGREATRRALADRGGKPDQSGLFASVLENWVVDRLLGGLLNPLYGFNIQQKSSYLADKLDQRIGSTALTITDDALLPGGLASKPYDGEGMSTRRRPLFESGVLRSFFLDTYYASKLGQEPTTAAPANLVFANGTASLAELLKKMDRGILVTSFSGGDANPATGDFSIGVRGQWIEKGQVVHPIAEMNLAGNHLQLWNKLAEVGNDPHVYSSMRTPSLRFEPIQFSGK